MSVNLGRVAYVEKGAYDSGTTYQKKDVVFYDGGSYVFIADAPAAGIVPTNAEYWQPMMIPARSSTLIRGLAVLEDASGDIVTITDGAEGMPVQRLITHIEPVQEGEGDPSPDNVRPISGWDSVRVANDTSGQNITQTLPETVYGGSLDWTTGLVTVTHISYVLDGVNNKFAGVYTAGGLRYAVYLLPFYGDKSNNKTSLLTSHLKTVQRVEYGCAYIAGAEGQQLLAYIQDFADVAEANAWLVEQAAAGTPFQICYKQATPHTIQLTPQQMETLKGVNNIWSNAGETEVTYVADTKLYIDKKIAAIAAAIV